MDLVTCDRCRERVPANVDRCPNCGAAMPMLQYRRWGFFLVIVMGAIAAVGLACKAFMP